MTRARTDPSAIFGNRIVAYGSVRANQVLANEENWRIHPRAQEEVVTGLLHDIGWVQGVIINKRSSPEWGRSQHVETLLDGELRILIALARGEDTEVPATFVDLAPDEERVMLAALDPSAALAGKDQEKLDALVAQLPDDLRELTAVLRADRRRVKKVEFEAVTRYRVVADCESEEQRQVVMNLLRQQGVDCHEV